jgi:hypothetical protein
MRSRGLWFGPCRAWPSSNPHNPEKRRFGPTSEPPWVVCGEGLDLPGLSALSAASSCNDSRCAQGQCQSEGCWREPPTHERVPRQRQLGDAKRGKKTRADGMVKRRRHRDGTTLASLSVLDDGPEDDLDYREGEQEEARPLRHLVRPPNVPPFSCGRSGKRRSSGRNDRARGSSARASGYSFQVTTRCGRPLQRLVGRRSSQAAPRVRSRFFQHWHAVSHEVARSVTGMPMMRQRS